MLSKSSKARDYKAEYRDYHSTPKHIKERAQRNAARRKLGLKRGDPREADHKNPISNGGSNSKRNLRAVSQDTNRRKGSTKKHMSSSALDRIAWLAPILKASSPSTIQIRANDSSGSLAELLNYIRHNGNGGHTFTIIVDPDLRENTKRFSWDGDGSDRIEEITVNGKILKAGWNEQDHPRAENGQFGSGSGSGSSSGKKPKPKSKPKKPKAQPRTQTTLDQAQKRLNSFSAYHDKITSMWPDREFPAHKEELEARKKEHEAASEIERLTTSELPKTKDELLELRAKIKATDTRPKREQEFEFPKSDPRNKRLHEINQAIREINRATDAERQAFAYDMDEMESGTRFANRNQPGATLLSEREMRRLERMGGGNKAPKERSPGSRTPAPEKKPVQQVEERPPKDENAGNGSAASYADMFGTSPKRIKVDGSIDYNKPYVLRISGKTFDHRDNLKALGFKWGPQSKTWYKGVTPGTDSKKNKAELQSHIERISSASGAPGSIRAEMTQGKLVPNKKPTMSADTARLFGVGR